MYQYRGIRRGDRQRRCDCWRYRHWFGGWWTWEGDLWPLLRPRRRTPRWWGWRRRSFRATRRTPTQRSCPPTLPSDPASCSRSQGSPSFETSRNWLGGGPMGNSRERERERSAVYKGFGQSRSIRAPFFFSIPLPYSVHHINIRASLLLSEYLTLFLNYLFNSKP